MNYERIKDYIEMTLEVAFLSTVFYGVGNIIHSDNVRKGEVRAAHEVKILCSEIMDEDNPFMRKHSLAGKLVSDKYYQIIFPELKEYYKTQTWRNRSNIKSIPEDETLEKMMDRCDSIIVANE